MARRRRKNYRGLDALPPLTRAQRMLLYTDLPAYQRLMDEREAQVRREDAAIEARVEATRAAEAKQAALKKKYARHMKKYDAWLAEVEASMAAVQARKMAERAALQREATNIAEAERLDRRELGRYEAEKEKYRRRAEFIQRRNERMAPLIAKELELSKLRRALDEQKKLARRFRKKEIIPVAEAIEAGFAEYQEPIRVLTQDQEAARDRRMAFRKSGVLREKMVEIPRYMSDAQVESYKAATTAYGHYLRASEYLKNGMSSGNCGGLFRGWLSYKEARGQGDFYLESGRMTRGTAEEFGRFTQQLDVMASRTGSAMQNVCKLSSTSIPSLEKRLEAEKKAREAAVKQTIAERAQARAEGRDPNAGLPPVVKSKYRFRPNR